MNNRSMLDHLLAGGEIRYSEHAIDDATRMEGVLTFDDGEGTYHLRTRAPVELFTTERAKDHLAVMVVNMVHEADD